MEIYLCNYNLTNNELFIEVLENLKNLNFTLTYYSDLGIDLRFMSP